MALPPTGSLAATCLALALVAMPVVGWGQAVALTGIMGGKALLVIDGGNPKLVSPGESFQGVRVVSTEANSAVLEVAGQRRNLRVGGHPVSVGQPVLEASGLRIVLTASADGHFVTQGSINSRPAQFMVDTGATAIGIGRPDAERMGLKYREGQPVMMETANGTTQGWRIKLASVKLNDVEVREVDAIVTSNAMPYVLLGNTFLARFQMTRDSSQMVLVKRP